VVTVSGALYVDGNLEVQSGQTLDLATNNAALTVTGTTNAVAGGVGIISEGTGVAVYTGNYDRDVQSEQCGGACAFWRGRDLCHGVESDWLDDRF